MTQALVRFVCISPDHVRARTEPAGSVLTIVSAEWAFCAAGGSEPHRWEPVPGLNITEIRGRSRRSGPVEARSSSKTA